MRALAGGVDGCITTTTTTTSIYYYFFLYTFFSTY